MFESWVLPSKTVSKFGSYHDLDLSSALVGMLMSSSKLFHFSNEVHLQTVIGIVRSPLPGIVLFHSHLDLPQVDLMNFRVEYVRPRSDRCLGHERSSFVRRVLNKQDEGLFRKSNSHQACRDRYYLSEINNDIYSYQFTFKLLQFCFRMWLCFRISKEKILANRLIWRNKGKDRRICIPLFTPLNNSWFRKSLASSVIIFLTVKVKRT